MTSRATVPAHRPGFSCRGDSSSGARLPSSRLRSKGESGDGRSVTHHLGDVVFLRVRADQTQKHDRPTDRWCSDGERRCRVDCALSTSRTTMEPQTASRDIVASPVSCRNHVGHGDVQQPRCGGRSKVEMLWSSHSATTMTIEQRGVAITDRPQRGPSDQPSDPGAKRPHGCPPTPLEMEPCRWAGPASPPADKMSMTNEPGPTT